MREIYNIITTTNEELNLDKKFAYYNGYNLTTVDNIDILTTQDIIYSNGNERDLYFVQRNINILLNKTLNKSSYFSYIPLSKMLNHSTSGYVLMSQGEGNKPIWKDINVVLNSNIKRVVDSPTLLLEGSTFITSNFLSSIVGNQFVSNLGDILETKNFNNDTGVWYSHRGIIKFTPQKCVVKRFDSYVIEFTYPYNMILNKSHNYIILSKDGSARTVSAITTAVAGSQYTYSVLVAELGYDFSKDESLYIGGQHLKTSIVDITDNFHNYISNELDYTEALKDYNIDVWGETNSISTNIPYKSGIRTISFYDHYGFIIGNDFVLSGFGTDTTGELLNKPSGKFIDVSCGLRHCCAIDTNYNLVAWGDQSIISRKPSGEFKKVVSTEYATACITLDNKLLIFGDFLYKSSNIPTEILDVKDVCFGDKFICVLLTNGSIQTYGDDTYGQVTNTPKGIFKKVKCGKYHIVALKEDGNVVMWGSNVNLQLENFNNTIKYLDIACGDYFTVLLKTNNLLVTIGNNTSSIINNTPISTYNNIFASGNNAVGLKDKTISFKKVYKEQKISGSKISALVLFDDTADVLTSIELQLNSLI